MSYTKMVMSPSEVCNHNILLLRSLAFLTGFSFYSALYTIELNNALGSVTAVGIVVSSRAMAAVAFEVPSGILADMIGRRFTLILATGSRLMSCIILIESTSLIHFVFSSACAGIADAMVSGTDHALIYDSLKAAGREDEFQRILATASLMWPMAACIASVGGGFLSDIGGLQLTAIATSVPLFLALLCAAWLVEPQVIDRTVESTSRSIVLNRETRSIKYAVINGWFHLVAAGKEFLADRRLLVVLVFSSLTYAFSETVHNLKGVFLLDRGVPVASQGWWNAVSFALSSMGAMHSEIISGRFGDLNTLVLCNVFSGITMFAATLDSTRYFPLLLISGSFTWGAQWPVASHLLNSCSSSRRRATIISLVSLVKKLGLAIFAPGLAFVIDAFCHQSNTMVLAFQSASLLLLAIPLVLLWYPSDQSLHVLSNSFSNFMDELGSSEPNLNKAVVTTKNMIKTD
eukprot:CFRG1686T1